MVAYTSTLLICLPYSNQRIGSPALNIQDYTRNQADQWYPDKFVDQVLEHMQETIFSVSAKDIFGFETRTL